MSENDDLTSGATPSPILLKSLDADHCGRWVPVTEALPPKGLPVLVTQRGDNCPAFGWLKFAAGDKSCPYFVCPQGAAMESRGCHISKPDFAKHRTDVTHWWVPYGEGLPFCPTGFTESDWGLGVNGWEYVTEIEEVSDE